MKLDPKCFDERMHAFAVTNRGQLLPCCWLDDARLESSEEFQKLLMVSHISDYATIEEILETPEWKEFYRNLKKDIGFSSCYNICKKAENSTFAEHTYIEEDIIVGQLHQ